MEFFLVFAAYLCIKNQLIMSLLSFNVALSIKGGSFFWLPGYLLVLAKKRGILMPIFFLAATVAIQIGMAWPFI